MGLICKLVGHGPDLRRTLWNEGWFFGPCRRCGTDLFRGDGPWAPVPRGHRVAWKPGYHRHSLSSDWGRNMPVAAGPATSVQPGLLERLFWRRPLALPGPDMTEARPPTGLVLAAIALLGFGLPWLRPRAR